MGGFNPVQIIKPKSVVQPKVTSQMNAPKPSTPAGPTTVEAAYDQTKRRGRKSTLLTSSTGVSEPVALQLKTLLGG